MDSISGDLGPSLSKDGLAGVCVEFAWSSLSPGRWNTQGQTWWRECNGFEGPTRCGSTGNKSCFGGDAKVKEQRLDAVVSEDILDDMIQCAPTFPCYLMTGYLSDSVQQRTCLLAALAALTMLGGAGQAADYIIGADLSFLKQAEERGAVFQDQGQAKPGLRLFKDHGYNWVRLRLFHTPTNLPNNLAYTIASASDAKKLGFEFLLNYHYSDTWALPGDARRAARVPRRSEPAGPEHTQPPGHRHLLVGAGRHGWTAQPRLLRQRRQRAAGDRCFRPVHPEMKGDTKPARPGAGAGDSQTGDVGLRLLA